MLIFGKWKRWESRRNELNSLFISLKSENSNTVRFDATNFKFPAHLCKCGHKNRLNFQSFSLVTFNFVGSCNGHWIIGPFLKTFGAILNCFNWNSDCRGIWNSGKEFLQCSSVLSRKIRRWTWWMSLVTSRRVNIELAAIDREKRNRCSSTFFLFPRCITIFFSLSLSLFRRYYWAEDIPICLGKNPSANPSLIAERKFNRHLMDCSRLEIWVEMTQ